jgi:hypothetical protein
MTDVEKLSEAIAAATAYPTGLEQLRAAWAKLLHTLYSLDIPLPPKNGNGSVEVNGHRLEYTISFGSVTSLYATNASNADEEARALIALVPELVKYLERLAQTARDATVVADAIHRALEDERVQAALAMRALEK